jgi:hypothetical protein
VAKEQLAGVDVDISARFAAVARDIGMAVAAVNQATRFLLTSAEEWMSSEHAGPPSQQRIFRWREACHECALAASRLEPPLDLVERVARRRPAGVLGSAEPPHPRSGRDYDYFAELRQVLGSSNVDLEASPPVS